LRWRRLRDSGASAALEMAHRIKCSLGQIERRLTKKIGAGAATDAESAVQCQFDRRALLPSRREGQNAIEDPEYG
jgi:hypothetical protein